MKALQSAPETVIRFPLSAHCTVRTLGHIRYDTPWKHFPRNTNEYILYLIESGDLYIEEDGVCYHLKKTIHFYWSQTSCMWDTSQPVFPIFIFTFPALPL